MRLGSLFDGSGGFPLAGVLCGIEPSWAAEVEPYPIAVTRSRFPDMKHLGDISKVNGAEIESVDIITFGSPCQDLSVAGKRAGLKHEANGDEETTRSGLFMEAVRIIKEMREATNGIYPRFALWENVPGAFSSNKGEDFRIVLEELIKIVEPGASVPPVPKNGWSYADSYIGDGWSLAYRVFDAQYWGVPQRRRRIHLVLDLRGECAREVLFEREGVRGYFTEGRTPWQTTAGDAQDCSGADDRTREGDGGRGLDDVKAYTMKERAGCAGGGKGPLIQTNLSATLQTSNDQYLFQPVYAIDKESWTSGQGFDRSPGITEGGPCPTLQANGTAHAVAVPVASAGFCPEQSAKTRGIGYQDEIAPTLRADVTPAVVYDARGNGGGNTVSTITGDHENRITDYTNVVVEQEPVYCLQGNGIDRADTAGCNGKGWKENTSYTLNTIDRPAVAYATDVGFFDSLEEQSPTLLARGYKDPHLVSYPESAVHYIVRRLTPTECARLQGFADRWGDIEKKSSFTPDEYAFWLAVRNTHAAINGRVVKDYTEAQMLTWYNKLHTDSAEYKMWGNGIALPPALYCMQGMAEVLLAAVEDDWML